MSYDAEYSMPSTPEAVLEENPLRFVLFPIQYGEIWSLYKESLSAFWIAEDIDLSSDVLHWTKGLSVQEQEVAERLLCCIVSVSPIDYSAWITRFCHEIQIPEARCFFGYHLTKEHIHFEFYSGAVTAFIADVGKRSRIFEEFQHFPCVEKMRRMELAWLSTNKFAFADRLLAYSFWKGVRRTSIQIATLWLTGHGQMTNFAQANVLMRHDYELYNDFTRVLLSLFHHKPPFDRVQSIAKEVVDVEVELFKELTAGPLIGMTDGTMLHYVQCTANELAQMLGYERIYDGSAHTAFPVRIDATSNRTHNQTSQSSEVHTVYSDNGRRTMERVELARTKAIRDQPFTLDADF